MLTKSRPTWVKTPRSDNKECQVGADWLANEMGKAKVTLDTNKCEQISGKISHAYRQFFMGHKGDIEARYTTNKGRLPKL